MGTGAKGGLTERDVSRSDCDTRGSSEPTRSRQGSSHFQRQPFKPGGGHTLDLYIDYRLPLFPQFHCQRSVFLCQLFVELRQEHYEGTVWNAVSYFRVI